MHYADLHNHTTASDGDFTPRELVALYAERGVRALGITDHDTLDGLPEGLAAGREAGVQVVPGVEVTLRFSEPLFTGSLHLLLYFPEALLEREDFLADCAQTFSLGRGPALVRARVEALNAHYGPAGLEPVMSRELTEAELFAQTDQVSRKHFAVTLAGMGLDKATVMRLIGNDSPAYIPSGMRPEDLAPLLGRWPFVRVLAHPAAGSYPGEGHYKEVLPPYETVEALLPRFTALGLDGLEAHYPGHTPDLTERVIGTCRALGLPLVTGGSDCHDMAQRPPATEGVGAPVLAMLMGMLAVRARAQARS
ncbi:MAG: PHP domain-containing protein [Deltaproteobacteria bacterium]|nr:PHP domain-containing protein [Deltaproteobacteria bacterium]